MGYVILNEKKEPIAITLSGYVKDSFLNANIGVKYSAEEFFQINQFTPVSFHTCRKCGKLFYKPMWFYALDICMRCYEKMKKEEV